MTLNIFIKGDLSLQAMTNPDINQYVISGPPGEISQEGRTIQQCAERHLESRVHGPPVSQHKLSAPHSFCFL